MIFDINIVSRFLDILLFFDGDAASEGLKFLGVELVNQKAFFKLLTKFVLNASFVFVIVRYIYFPTNRRKEYLFTYILISFTIFFLCYLLESVKLELGFALGLFAIFGIIRYRTDTVPIKEMTYLFIIIGVTVINALSNKKVSYSELLLANVTIVFLTYGFERIWLINNEQKKNILYEKIELIKPEKHQELIADLSDRLGIEVKRVEITQIDFLRDVAQLKVYYDKNEEI